MARLFTRRSAGISLLAAMALPAPAFARLAVPLSHRALTGVWRGIYREGGAVIGGEILFKPNGTYRHTQVLGALMAWASGTYSIASIWVHFEIEAYGPEEYNGMRQYRPLSETWMVDRFDGETLDARIGAAVQVHYERVA